MQDIPEMRLCLEKLQMSNPMTVDEIVSYLRHCHTPTLLVEGTTDQQIFDCLENDCQISIFPCSGKENLLKVFKRRNEFSHTPCVFLADCDMWLFVGIPALYQEGIILTKGYSIENDVIASSGLEIGYNQNDLALLNRLKDLLSEWWAFEIHEYTTSGRYEANFKVQGLVLEANDINLSHLNYRKFIPKGKEYVKRSNEEISTVRDNFDLYIQGHILEDLHRFIVHNKKGHESFSHNIIQICLWGKNKSSLFVELEKKIIDSFKSAAI